MNATQTHRSALKPLFKHDDGALDPNNTIQERPLRSPIFNYSPKGNSAISQADPTPPLDKQSQMFSNHQDSWQEAANPMLGICERRVQPCLTRFEIRVNDEVGKRMLEIYDFLDIEGSVRRFALLYGVQGEE